MAALFTLAMDAVKLLGGPPNIGMQNLVHVGHTYRGCQIGGNCSRGGSSLCGIVAAGTAFGAAAIAARSGLGEGVQNLYDTVVMANRVVVVEEGDDWAASVYIRTIDATFVVRTIEGELSLSLSPGKGRGSLVAGEKEVAIAIPPGSSDTLRPGAKTKAGECRRIRTPDDKSTCPDRLDGVRTRAGWFVVIQRNGRVFAGVCSVFNSKTISSVDSDSVPPVGFRFLVDAGEAVSGVDQSRE
jgi:hypothetical protein